jgi:methionine-rich copper-binding protein CopC
MSRRDILERARRVVLSAFSLVLLGAGTAQPPSISSAVPHITLESSTPEDEEAVDGAVTEVRLFFSEAPLMRGASIRVVNSQRKLIRSAPPEADAVDPRQLAVQLPEALPGGKYVIQWRCIADDGHVMRGSFTFDVVGR